MVPPDKAPVYATTPAAPKLIVLPVRLPLMWRFSGGDDSMIVPSSAFAVCVQVTVRKPLNGPVDSPSHVPLRSRFGGVVGRGSGGVRPIAPRQPVTPDRPAGQRLRARAASYSGSFPPDYLRALPERSKEKRVPRKGIEPS
jgi:hypothetical protein